MNLRHWTGQMKTPEHLMNVLHSRASGWNLFWSLLFMHHTVDNHAAFCQNASQCDRTDPYESPLSGLCCYTCCDGDRNSHDIMEDLFWPDLPVAMVFRGTCP